MLVQDKLYTAEEFWEIVALPENDGKRLELVNGVIVEMAESSSINTILGIRMGKFLANFVDDHELGWVAGADSGFQLGPHKIRQPDVAFISKARAPEIPKRFKVAPEIAVEIVSPDEDIFSKVKDYLHGGTRQVWAVYPDVQSVDVFTLDTDGSIRAKPFGLDDTLDGGDILPGFTLPVRDIFSKIK